MSSTARQKIKRIIKWLIAGVAVCYLSLCGLLSYNETSFIFPGASENYGSQIQYSPLEGLRDVHYITEDQVQLHGRMLVRENASRYIVFFHGNGERAEWLDDWARRLSDAMDANVLIAEYRGYAEGDKTQPTETGLLADGLAATRWLSEEFDLPPSDVICYGRSIGGAVAVSVASRLNSKLLILERTFDRLVDVAAEKLWCIPVRWLMTNRFDSVEYAANYSGRVIQIHGDQDRLIPIQHGRQLFDSFSGDSQWISVNGLGHNDPLPDSILRQIRQSVDRQE